MGTTEDHTSEDGERLAFEDLPAPAFNGTVSPDELHVDGENPNEMDDRLFDLLADRITERGWLGGPIITDTDGCIADGEHRWRAARSIGLTEVPVKQYDLDEHERRLLRQELNKLRGEHHRGRDIDELAELLSSPSDDDIEELLVATDSYEDVLDELDGVDTPSFDPLADDDTRLDETDERKDGDWSHTTVDGHYVRCPECSHEFHPGLHKVEDAADED